MNENECTHSTCVRIISISTFSYKTVPECGEGSTEFPHLEIVVHPVGKMEGAVDSWLATMLLISSFLAL
jgi:hypothetical protein